VAALHIGLFGGFEARLRYGFNHFFSRGPPLLAQLYLIYYGLPQFDCLRRIDRVLRDC
jgi:ABC-type arginine/histidine transport system permease subunit